VPYYAGINLASNKPSIQSSTYTINVASRAIDGGFGTVSCTVNHVHPYWSVDLEALYDVGLVTLTNDVNVPKGNYSQITHLLSTKRCNRRVEIWMRYAVTPTPGQVSLIGCSVGISSPPGEVTSAAPVLSKTGCLGSVYNWRYCLGVRIFCAKMSSSDETKHKSTIEAM